MKRRKKQKTEPIKDAALLQEIIDYLDQKNKRDSMLFKVGIYCGLRVSELIDLRVIDVKNRDFIETIGKGDKDITIPIPRDLRKDIKAYIKEKEVYEYLFPSQKGGHISRRRASQIMEDIAEMFDLEHFNTHSMRKTYAHMLYRKTKDIALVQMALGHESPATTYKYLGLKDKYLRDNLEKFSPL